MKQVLVDFHSADIGVAPGLAAAASIWQWAIVARTNRYSTEAVERRMNHPSPASVDVPIMVHSVHE